MFDLADCADKRVGLPWKFLLLAVINWSHRSLRTAAVYYIVSWPPFTSIWSYSYLIACCFLFLRLPVLYTVFECAYWVICWVAAIAASRWTNLCLRCRSVSLGGAWVEAPVVRLDSDSIAPGSCVSAAMTCCGGKVRKMITKRSGNSWRLYSYLQVKMKWVTANMHFQFKLNPAAYSCRGFQWSCDLE